MYGYDILCGISKGPFEIPHKISYSYIARYDFYAILKFHELLDLRAHNCFWNAPQSLNSYDCLLHGTSCHAKKMIMHLYSFQLQLSYRKTSSISCTKSQNLNASCIVLRLSSLNPLKPGVKLRTKM